MKQFWLALIVLGVGLQPVLAEDLPDSQKNRQAAAERYLSAVSMQSLVDDMTAQVAANLPEEEGRVFAEFMSETIRWEVLEQAALSSMVRNFTTQELNALAAFNESPEGRSAMKKMGRYAADIMPALQREMLRAMQELEARGKTGQD